MIRITGGEFRGRAVESPPRSKDIRPTTGLIRESIFSSLQQEVPGCRFLDLFAGSGIMGIEALSRGASFVLAVEADTRQARVIRDNYARLGLTESRAKVIALAAEKLVSRANREEPFDIAFLDPPYGYAGMASLVESLIGNGWLREGGQILVEHGIRDRDLPGFARRNYGDTSLSSRRIG